MFCKVSSFVIVMFAKNLGVGPFMIARAARSLVVTKVSD